MTLICGKCNLEMACAGVVDSSEGVVTIEFWCTKCNAEVLLKMDKYYHELIS
jgi:hypothetical protein